MFSEKKQILRICSNNKFKASNNKFLICNNKLNKKKEGINSFLFKFKRKIKILLFCKKRLLLFKKMKID